MSYSTASREMLLENIREVFVARGYDGATLMHLASATGLSRASLYHHFPGGKPEMASTLVRQAIVELQTLAFNALAEQQDAISKLTGVVAGFGRYTQDGSRSCVLAILMHHKTAGDDIEALQVAISSQFDDWHRALTETFIAGGMKKKKAQQAAYDVTAHLYGALLNAKLHSRPELFKQATKKLHKQIGKWLPDQA